MKTVHLGQNKSLEGLPASKILTKMKRPKKLISQFYGYDLWNIYEFPFLLRGRPQLRIIQIKFPQDFPVIIESKSMKLYANSFYNKDFKKQDQVLQRLKSDLKTKTIAPNISFINKIENLSDILAVKHKNIFKFKGFRSICPVTRQPDWATIYIYSRTNLLDRKYLKEFLLSFREQGDFHESCITQIFNTTLQSLKSPSLNKKTHLEVVGKFLRRGGIDINPIRSTHKQMLLGKFREIQQ